MAHNVRLSPSGRNLGQRGTWHTLLDFDFAAQPSVGLGSDATYSIGGYNWTKQNSANDVIAAQIVNGTGLVFCPVAGLYAFETGLTCPMLTMPITNLVSDPAVLTAERPLRLAGRGWFGGTGVLSNFLVCSGLYYSTNSLFFGSRLFRASVARGGQCRIKHAATTEDVMDSTQIAEALDCWETWIPDGVGGLSIRYARALWAGGWPEFPYLAAWDPDSNWWAIADWPGVSQLANWQLAVFAQGQSSGVALTYVVQNVRLQAYY